MTTNGDHPLHSLIAAGKLPNVTRVSSTPTPPAAHPEALGATQRLIERLEAQLTPNGPTQDEAWYGWIPLPPHQFTAGMLYARELLGDAGRRFVDVGSGIGTKLILAHELGWKAAGVERWAPYVETSRRIAPFAHVFQTNAATFQCYHHFDVVYLYGIAVQVQEHDRINRLISDRMKPGALFFCARRPFPDWLEHQGGLIWRKPLSA